MEREEAIAKKMWNRGIKLFKTKLQPQWSKEAKMKRNDIWEAMETFMGTAIKKVEFLKTFVSAMAIVDRLPENIIMENNSISLAQAVGGLSVALHEFYACDSALLEHESVRTLQKNILFYLRYDVYCNFTALDFLQLLFYKKKCLLLGYKNEHFLTRELLELSKRPEIGLYFKPYAIAVAICLKTNTSMDLVVQEEFKKEARECLSCAALETPQGSISPIFYQEKIQEKFESVYEKGELLGKGTYGSVYKCCHKKTVFSLEVAVKIFDKNSFALGMLQTSEVMREIGILSSAWMKNCPFLAYSLDVFAQNDNQWNIVIPYLDGGDLRKFLEKNIALKKNWKLKQRKHILKCVCEGLSYLHEHGVFHRDLKPENVIVSKRCQQVMVVDYSLSRFFHSDASVSMTGNVCSMWYRAPEILTNKSDQRKLYDGLGVDLWAFGCIMGEMYCGIPLFPNSEPQEDLQFSAQQKKIQEYLDHRAEKNEAIFLLLENDQKQRDHAMDLLNGFLQPKAQERVLAWDALQHPFFLSEQII